MFGKKKQSFEGVTVYTAFHHINGLPIAENLLCEVFSYPDRIEFKAGTTNIKLAREKLLICALNLIQKSKIRLFQVWAGQSPGV